ncbi:MAG TPA: protein kinase [Polyangiaceae bacterium]|jgi:serine/threonine-protein kinase|nr:MAG: Serine/threonine-protein kinase PrkC [Deltaproteobacteria bacterium ADurb.Bin207]HNS98661.1 protein kinase [Polyangiaceae bacterium]HNZ23323.1 protein kinase [Polyangiaceae bacterium]HOD21907.1 protein kinase [Polyangiaceae bacterium]HOE49352.1 protein kinase [Polyangiaceae bacterium]
MTAKSSDKNLGKVIAGRYRLETRIGEGGMGVVYRARHVLIDRVVALKLIRPDLRGETHLRAWMLREARAANRVDHAHIVDIHDIGETDEGELYLVMEYLVGISLSSEIARGPFPVVRAVDILEQMCAALARAHDLGVVHRDLKSDNIMLTVKGGRKDSVKILDFGLAGLARDPRLAPKGAVFGTPEYMSPEQARGEEAGPKSDLYALGVLFFEMSIGQLPFKSPDRDTLLEMQRNAPAPRPSKLRPDLPPAAESIMLRLLEKDPRKRFLDAHHLQEQLKALQRSLPSRNWDVGGQGETPAPPPPPPPQSEGVTEWANRAALFSRMVARAYHQGNAPRELEEGVAKAWDLAARASRLEGEVATHTRKLEALEKRGRGLRAEIGRKVEELAHEESRALREVAKHQEELERMATEMRTAEREAAAAKHAADAAEKTRTFNRAIFERAGAAIARATLLHEQVEKLQQLRASREVVARDLRRQIEELRNQLVRYAEALEEDLAAGREKVAVRTREGIAFERSFSEVCGLLIAHLKNKPEVRDLMNELMPPSADRPTRSQDVR